MVRSFVFSCSAEASVEGIYLLNTLLVEWKKYISDIKGKLSLLLSQRDSFVTVKIFESKILMNFDVFEVPESE